MSCINEQRKAAAWLELCPMRLSFCHRQMSGVTSAPGGWLANRVFETYEAIIDAACEAWRKLIELPEIITSIGTRDWAHVGHR
jgi:hypothetical protein